MDAERGPAWDSTRAASSTPARPEALSLAPGASASPSLGFDARESMSPAIST